MAFSTFPSQPSIHVEPFKIDTPQSDIDHLNLLLKHSRIPKATYENTQTTENFGITRKWLEDARDNWLNEFGWKKEEEHINSIPGWLASLKNQDEREYKIHFVGLFSKRKDAIPIILSHGWPGCFLEFLPLLEIIKARWAEDELPYHLVVPSLPGWAYSTAPPTDKEFTIQEVGYLFNSLMTGLGFNKYIAQGGDIGSKVTCELAVTYEACTAAHVNFRAMFAPPEGTPEYEQMKKEGGPDMNKVVDLYQPFGYALEHGTRPGTIGLAISSNPISLLSWIAEKYLEWSDESPSLHTILTIVTLYWLTDTYPSSIYTYRYSQGCKRGEPQPEDGYISKPFGYSLFTHELAPTPIHWVEKVVNMVFSREHKDGGHFAALEKPEVLWKDVEEFVAKTWVK